VGAQTLQAFGYTPPLFIQLGDPGLFTLQFLYYQLSFMLHFRGL